MAGPLNALLAGLSGTNVKQAATSAATPSAPIPQTPDLNATTSPVTDPNAPAPPTQVDGVTVTAPSVHPSVQPAGPSPYDNTAELAAINKVQAQYPDMGQNTPGVGRFIPNSALGGNGGTLRNILGTLGDAFLISSGHQPMHRLQDQANQVAQSAAGFDTDPAAAAARIATTGAPGSIQDAQSMMNSALENKRILAQQDFNNTYKTDNLNLRQDQVQSQVAQRQALMEDKTRQAMGGMLAAAAASGDPAQYAAARQRALTLGKSRISNFDPDIEVPANLNDYSAGYGMTAGQVARNQTSQASIAERAQAANQSNQTRNRAISVGASNNRDRVQATVNGQNISDAGQMHYLQNKQNNREALTPAEQKVWDRLTHVPPAAGSKLPIPGLTPSGGNGNGQFSHIATGPNGHKMGWNGKQWIPIS